MPRVVAPVIASGTLAALEQPTLQAGSEVLRPWLKQDAAEVLEAFDDPEIQRWHMRTMSSESEALDWIESWDEAWRNEQDASWAVVHAGKSELVGYVALRALTLTHAQAQLTYWVVRGARGTGVASRAGRAVSRWALSDLRLHRLEIRHSVLNEASCRVATKLGYTVEGTLTKAMPHSDGWHDVHLHARVERDPSRPER